MKKMENYFASTLFFLISSHFILHSSVVVDPIPEYQPALFKIHLLSVPPLNSRECKWN